MGASDARVGRAAIFWVVVKDLFGNTIGSPTPASTVNCTLTRDGVATPGPNDIIATTVLYVASNTTWTVSYTPANSGRYK